MASLWSNRVRLFSAILTLLLAGCGDGDGRMDPGAAAPDPVRGGTLRIVASTDIEFANPLVSSEAYTQEINRHLLFTPLVRYDRALEYEPWLARSWELVGDTAIVFRLRDDVRWHDGEPTTAYDVAFTFERAKDPETAFPNASDFEHWDGVEVVDSFRVRFRIQPHTDPLAAWALTPIVPRHLLDSIPPAEMRTAPFNKAPVGNGPFRFVSQRANDRWVFAANPEFPEALGGRPHIDRVVWRVVPENSAQLTEMLTGGADLALQPPLEQIDRVEAASDVRVITKPTRKYDFIGWNGRRPPLGDARVRRALTLAIDRREILEVLRGGYGTIAVGPVAPYHWAFDESLEPIPFDPEAARALLAEAGWRDRDGDGALEDPSGRAFTFDLAIPAQNDLNRSMAEMIQSDLRDIGVRMNVRPLDFSTLISGVVSPERRFDAVILAWEDDFRVDLRPVFHSEEIDGPYQLAGYRNARVDELIERVALTDDRSVARPIWAELQAILREEQPWTFLFYYPNVYAANDRVRGVEMDIRGAFVTLPEWWIEPREE